MTGLLFDFEKPTKRYRNRHKNNNNKEKNKRKSNDANHVMTGTVVDIPCVRLSILNFQLAS